MNDERNHSGTADDGPSGTDLAPFADNIVGTAATVATIVANLDAASEFEQRGFLERFAESVRVHADEYHALARAFEDHLRRTAP